MQVHRETRRREPRRRPYVKVAVVYLILGVLWILGSDWLVSSLANDEETLTFLQTAKGWFFVLVSSVLIFALSRRAFRDLEKSEAAKRELFRSTLGASDHILLNYLNQMQLVRLEAERCSDFSEDVLHLADEISKETVEELRRLERTEAGCPADIEDFLNRRLREARRAVERTGTGS